MQASWPPSSRATRNWPLSWQPATSTTRPRHSQKPTPRPTRPRTDRYRLAPLHRQAAEMGAGIDDQELSGDVAGAREEEDHRLGDLLGRACLAQRRRLLLGVAQFLVVLLAECTQQPARLNEARAHRVHAHRRTEPARQRQGE